MADREKVIKEAEETLSCVLPDEKDTLGIMVKVGWIRDVIAILKEDKLCEAALDLLVDMELTCICDDMAPCDWCEEHCKSGQSSPDRECWEHYLRGE